MGKRIRYNRTRAEHQLAAYLQDKAGHTAPRVWHDTGMDYGFWFISEQQTAPYFLGSTFIAAIDAAYRKVEQRK